MQPHRMNEIEIEHKCYCPDNGYFCPFMDRSGFCIATSCKRGCDLIEQRDIERRAQAEEDKHIDLWWMVNDGIEIEYEYEFDMD